MNIKEAREYINFNIKEGIWDIEQFEGMTDSELIEFAEYEMERADNYWNNPEPSDN